MTTPDTTRLAEIRARLDAATDGPWEATPNDRILGQPRPEHAGERAVAEALLSVDADLIAHAPADLAFLLSELEAAQTRLDAVEMLAQRMENEHGQSWNSISGRRIREALRLVSIDETNCYEENAE